MFFLMELEYYRNTLYSFNAGSKLRDFGLNAANFFIRYLDLKNINHIFILFIKISILNVAFELKILVLDAALKS